MTQPAAKVNWAERKSFNNTITEEAKIKTNRRAPKRNEFSFLFCFYLKWGNLRLLSLFLSFVVFIARTSIIHHSQVCSRGNLGENYFFTFSYRFAQISWDAHRLYLNGWLVSRYHAPHFWASLDFTGFSDHDFSHFICIISRPGKVIRWSNTVIEQAKLESNIYYAN